MSRCSRIVILVAAICAACRPTPEAPGMSGDAAPTASDANSADADGGDSRAEAAAPSPPGAEEAVVKAAGSSHGYLTDNANNALYFLEGNQNGEKCDAACQEAWPPVTASGGRTSAGKGAPRDVEDLAAERRPISSFTQWTSPVSTCG